MSDYTFNKFENNYTPSYKFDNVANTVKAIAQNEVLNLAKVGLFSISDLKNKLNNREPEYTFNNDEKSSYLKDTNRIVNITFLPTSYINEFGQTAETPELKLEICVMGVDYQNNVVETSLMNERGTIKQIVSQSDFKVNISGVLIGYFIQPTTKAPLAGKPVEDMRKLISIAESKIAVKVASDYLNNFGIDKIVINSLNIPQEITSINLQRFTIQAVSDNDDLVIL